MYIYKTINLINGKIYIGQSKFDPEENPDYLGSGYLLMKAIKCYGREQFKKEILERCNCKENLCERERYWIAILMANVRGVGYNICEGGAWGDTFTHNPRADEIRAKFRVLNKGKSNPNYGNRWTEEQRKAAAKRRRESPTVIDQKTGINIAKLPEVRLKLSQTKMGLLNPRASLWKLISPVGEEFLIEGGIKHEIKRYGVDYQQFTIVVDSRTRMNHNGWRLEKLPKPELEESE